MVVSRIDEGRGAPAPIVTLIVALIACPCVTPRQRANPAAVRFTTL
jgi:hypothetical protein